MADDVALDPPSHDPRRANLASDIVRLAALWVAAGALFKLFAGSPNDLPPMVKEFEYLSVTNTFRAAIAIELCLVTLALFRPRWGWAFLVLLFGVFGYVLWPLVESGAETCGCFGSKVKLEPLHMMILDGIFLVAILAVRPWSALPRRPLQPLLLLPLFGLSIWAPYEMFRTREMLPPPRPRPEQAAPARPAVDTQAAPAEETPDPGPDRPPVEAEATDVAVEQPVEQDPAAGEQAPAASESSAAALPDFHWFEPESWKDQLLFDIDLAAFVDVALVPDTAHVVFYRQTCEHCAAHLEQLSLSPPAEPLVLVRVPETTDTEANKVTHVLPAAVATLELPMLERGYGIQTPMSIDVAGYTVTAVEIIEHE